LVLFDLVKCFDKIKRQHIWNAMAKMGVPAKLTNVVRATLEGSSALLHVEGIRREIMQEEGTGQGTTLGPVLCNFFLLPILLQWQDMWAGEATTLLHADGTKVHSLLHSFADDTAIIAKTREAAERISKALHGYLQDFLLDVHVADHTTDISKSVVLLIPGRTRGGSATGSTNMKAPLKMGDGSCWINFVEKATYLGHTITADLLDEHHIRARMAKASQVFGALRRPLFGNKQVWKVVKASVMKTVVLPTLLDGIENCIITDTVMGHMESLYHRHVRSCLRVTPYQQRKYKIRNETLLKRLGLQPLHYYLDLKLLGYAGHVQRMPPTRLPIQLRDTVMEGPRRPGRPQRGFAATLNASLMRKGVTPAKTPIKSRFDNRTKISTPHWTSIAANKTAWAKAIRKPSALLTARVNPPKKVRRYPDHWANCPNCVIGEYVEKKFDAKWYIGKITGTDVDFDTNEQIWTVLYDDGDTEDYNGIELNRIIGLDLRKYLPAE
jgi:hypothetical protein